MILRTFLSLSILLGVRPFVELKYLEIFLRILGITLFGQFSNIFFKRFTNSVSEIESSMSLN